MTIPRELNIVSLQTIEISIQMAEKRTFIVRKYRLEFENFATASTWTLFHL